MPFIAPVSDLAPAGGTTAFGDPILGATPATGRKAQDIGDAIISGLQNSATGLAVRGKLPSVELPEDAPWYHRLAAGAASIGADVPLSVAGAIGGGVAGTAVEPGVGTAIGAGAGAFAAPMALREGLIEAYNNNSALSWSGVWDIAKASMKGGAKGAIIGGATAGVGGVVAKAALPLASPVARGAAAGGAELATLTATSAAVEGHMPTWQDFMDNALLLGGMKTAVHVAKGMRNVYAETGKSPAEVLNDVAKDPSIKAQLEASTGTELPAAYAPLALEQRIRAAIDADPRPEMIRETLANKETSTLTGPNPADPVKYEYITDNATSAGVLREVTALYQKEIETQTRGVVPNKQSAIDGLKMVTDGNVAPHIVGEAANSAEIWARAHILKGATNEAVAQLAKIKDIPALELSPMDKLSAIAALERVSMLNAEMNGVAAEAGRTLQVFRAIKRDPSYLGEAEALVKLAERKGSLQDIAKLVDGIKDPAQLAKFAKGYTEATTMEKVLEAWRASIFSGPLTLEANIMGNIGKWALSIPEQAVSAAMYAIDAAAKGDPIKMAAFKARALSPIYGLQLATKDLLRMTGSAADMVRDEGARATAVAAYKGLKAEDGGKLDIRRQANTGIIGELIQIPFSLLKLTDMPFRTVGERAETHIMAVDRALAENLTPGTREFREASTRYASEPTFGLSEPDALKALARISEAGDKATFQERLGPKTEAFQKLVNGTWAQFILPAIKTPANLTSWAIQHIPGLNLMSGRWREDYAAGGERRAQAVARVVVGTGIAALAYSMAEDGTMTGSGMFEKDQGGTKRAAGWQPNSVKVGDKYYSLARLEPVAKVMQMSADLIELERATKDPEDKKKIVTMLALMFGNATISTTYMSGIANTMNAVLDPDRYAGNLMEQYASSVVPKAIGQSVIMADPYKRQVDGVIDAIQSQLPLLREKLLPTRDVWGEWVKNERAFNVLPVATSEVSQDKVRTEAMRLQVGIADAPRFITERGPFKPGEQRVNLSQEERDVFKEVSGKNAMAILAPIVNSPDWASIPDFAKAAVYRNAIEGARKQGQYAALPADDADRVKLRQKIVDKIIKESQSATP